MGVLFGYLVMILLLMLKRLKRLLFIKMMEMEVGDGWIFHKHCLSFYSSHRVAGCLVAEPIKKAYRLLSNSDEKSDVATTRKDGKLTSATLQFGSISFQREFRRKNRQLKVRENQKIRCSLCCMWHSCNLGHTLQ